MIKGVRCRGRAQRMGADLEAEQRGILPDQLVNPVGSDCLLPIAPSTVTKRAKKRAGAVCAMSGRLQIVGDKIAGCAMERHVTDLFAFTGYFQMGHTASFRFVFPDAELAQLLAPKSMIEKGGQDGAVPYPFQLFLSWRQKQLARLMIGDRRRFPHLALHLRALHAFDRIVGDSILIAD